MEVNITTASGKAIVFLETKMFVFTVWGAAFATAANPHAFKAIAIPAFTAAYWRIIIECEISGG